VACDGGGKASYVAVSNGWASRNRFLTPFPGQVILAELDGHVIGMASFHSHYSTLITKPGIWLDDLFVGEAYRGVGAGGFVRQ
jgi:hypothetical protein